MTIILKKKNALVAFGMIGAAAASLAPLAHAQSTTGGIVGDLKPVEASYSGTIHMAGTGAAHECNLRITRMIDLVRGATDSPADTRQVPTLAAQMTFPEFATEISLADTNYQNYERILKSDLMPATGQNVSVVADHGAYDPRTRQLVLPYTVQGYMGGTYGELVGTLENGHFKGSWITALNGKVGTFDLAVAPESPAVAATPTSPTEVHKSLVQEVQERERMGLAEVGTADWLKAAMASIEGESRQPKSAPAPSADSAHASRSDSGSGSGRSAQ